MQFISNALTSVPGVRQAIPASRALRPSVHSLYSPCYQRLGRTISSARQKVQRVLPTIVEIEMEIGVRPRGDSA
jgi:hypothetical protein